MLKLHYGMLLSLWRFQLRHINHESINIATSILGGRRWHGIWRIRWSPTRYWRSLRLWRCFIWRSGWLLKNQGQLRWINDWIIQWMKQMYHRWWQIIALWVIVLSIKAPVITRIVLWRAGWMLINWGQMRWIDDWIIQWRRHRYHQWWQLIALYVNSLAIKAPVITSSRLLPTLIVPCSAIVATTNTLWTWHAEFDMILWLCCVPFILSVDGHQKVRAKCSVRQLQSFLSIHTRNKNW